MDILSLLDELQIIARNGLHYAQNPYDRERYERLMELTTRYYSEALDLPPSEVRERLSKELGYATPKVEADAAIFNVAGEILLVLQYAQFLQPQTQRSETHDERDNNSPNGNDAEREHLCRRTYAS
jgi:hypothetical protein